MKTKLVLPLLAVVFAIVGALASSPLVQTGWYDSNGSSPDGGMVGNITTPSGNTPVCEVKEEGSICLITNLSGTFNAYDSKVHAETADPDGLLRYTPAP